MTIIEPYVMAHAEGPRPCENSTAKDSLSFSIEKPCFAEVILHTHSGEMFLCKRHASHELRDNPTLMAAAVIELSLSAVTV
jgi:hypothetical protein